MWMSYSRSGQRRKSHHTRCLYSIVICPWPEQKTYMTCLSQARLETFYFLCRLSSLILVLYSEGQVTYYVMEEVCLFVSKPVPTVGCDLLGHIYQEDFCRFFCICRILGCSQ